MRKSRFTDERVVGIIRAADREPVAEVARLKKLVAERDPEIGVMREVAAKNW